MHKLEPGELRIARLFAEEGLTCREVANKIKVSLWSVRYYTGVILAKTGASRLPQAIYFLTKAGIL